LLLPKKNQSERILTEVLRTRHASTYKNRNSLLKEVSNDFCEEEKNKKQLLPVETTQKLMN